MRKTNAPLMIPPMPGIQHQQDLNDAHTNTELDLPQQASPEMDPITNPANELDANAHQAVAQHDLDGIAQENGGHVNYHKVVKVNKKWVKTLVRTSDELIVRVDQSSGLDAKNNPVTTLNAGNYGKQSKEVNVFSYFDDKNNLFKQEIQAADIKVLAEQEFSDQQFKNIKKFYNENAKKESAGTKGEGEADWKQCSPAMYYAMNILYGWEGAKKIKSGYVVDATIDGTFHKGIVSLMKEKGKVAQGKKFTSVDAEGRAGHLESALKEEVVGFDTSPTTWMKEVTGEAGLSIFLGSVSGGYHSITLCVDLRFGRSHYYLWDQHGNASTGSSSTFDRTKAHTKQELEDYFLKMMQSWGDGQKNHTISLYQLENK